ncbi:MAG: CBS domain-containing protein [Rhodobacteraceae bacterium]|nr:CBS domain-containing protein [Paracoccaceae bacterium]
MKVSQLLQAKPVSGVLSIKPGDTINTAAEMLSEHRIGALIVSTDGKQIDGILSERDIVREIGKNGIGCMSNCARDLMTSTVVACKPEDTVISLMSKMSNGRFRHMPVVDGGVLVGVVSIGDVVKARIELIEQENAALTDMIHGKV